ncbi:phage tail protein [Nitrospirillum amazonense]|uniref:phage tail protein n=1 Tax=Nitrospirillum amazonense TaxID=28077 RepID=UPI0024121B6D|nr:phage tail protein [Nitrospirillum amazonense]MDG3440652.1 phage tail protein [Nitrospirillum amazonense]
MSGETQTSTWPLPKFYFSVQLGNGVAATFQEAAGLDTGAQPTPASGPLGNVTLRKGAVTNGGALWDWFNQIKLNATTHQTVVINLRDEAGAVAMGWTLNNAFPTKITGADLKSEGNEVAVESLEVAFETLVITAP